MWSMTDSFERNDQRYFRNIHKFFASRKSTEVLIFLPQNLYRIFHSNFIMKFMNLLSRKSANKTKIFEAR